MRKKKDRVKTGDTVIMVKWVNGIPFPTDRITVTKENIRKLNIGNKENEGVTLNFGCIIDHLASRTGIDSIYLSKRLVVLERIYLPGVFSALLKEAAIMLDSAYTGHIRNSDEIWIVSLLDGKPHKADKSKIRNYNGFAAFRSKEDAEKALEALECCVHDLYGEQKD